MTPRETKAWIAARLLAEWPFARPWFCFNQPRDWGLPVDRPRSLRLLVLAPPAGDPDALDLARTVAGELLLGGYGLRIFKDEEPPVIAVCADAAEVSAARFRADVQAALSTGDEEEEPTEVTWQVRARPRAPGRQSAYGKPPRARRERNGCPLRGRRATGQR